MTETPNLGVMQQENLAEAVTCAICLDVCIRPTTTSCGHTFCRRCLRAALATKQQCPSCRSVVILPRDNQLAINFALWTLIQTLFPRENIPESPAITIKPSTTTNRGPLSRLHSSSAAPIIHSSRSRLQPFIPPRRVLPESSSSQQPITNNANTHRAHHPAGGLSPLPRPRSRLGASSTVAALPVTPPPAFDTSQFLGFRSARDMLDMQDAFAGFGLGSQHGDEDGPVPMETPSPAPLAARMQAHLDHGDGANNHDLEVIDLVSNGSVSSELESVTSSTSVLVDNNNRQRPQQFQPRKPIVSGLFYSSRADAPSRSS